MRILSVDPGLVCCGWAFWCDGQMTSSGITRTKETDLGRRVLDHAAILDKMYPDVLVIEKPEVYAQRFLKGDPEDLIHIAIVVGAIVHAAKTFEIRMPLPKTWKGQISKEISAARTLKKLSEEEKQRMGKVIPSLKHNMMDAIGIGLWALGR